MVTRINPHETVVFKYTGLSSDTKPQSDVPNGSSFYEMDTDDTYYFDASSTDWIKASTQAKEVEG